MLVFLLALLGTTVDSVTAQATPSAGRASTSSPGRFQIVISPHLRAATFLLDTQTGRVWRPVKYTDLEDEPRVWRPETRVDSEKEFQAWWNNYTPKKDE